MTSQKSFASKKSEDSTDRRQKAKPKTASPAGVRIDRLGLLRALANPLAASPADILNLQRTLGNRAVQRMIQAKLTVGPAGDEYEQEADRMASQVMSAPSQSAAIQPSKEEDAQRLPVVASIPRVAQRDVNEEEDELAHRLPLAQSASHLDGFEADSAFETRLAANQGRGAPLPDETRSFMESRFGADFSRVRVHTDGESANLNRELGAQAFTQGSDIYMGAGKYNPGALEGKRLLAHELTHVVQQGGGKSIATSISERGQATAVIQRTIWRWSANEQKWEPYYKTEDDPKSPLREGEEGEYFDDATDQKITENDAKTRKIAQAAGTGDWRLKTKSSLTAGLSEAPQVAYGCNAFNIRNDGLCHAAVMVRIAIELGQIDTLPEEIQKYLKRQKKENPKMSKSDLYDTFMSEIVKLDNQDKGSKASRLPLLAEFLAILDEQTKEKEKQTTFPKIKRYAQGGLIHITSLEQTDEEEIKISIEATLKEKAAKHAELVEEWNNKLKQIKNEAKGDLQKLKDYALGTCKEEKDKPVMDKAINDGDFSVVISRVNKNADKKASQYQEFNALLQPHVEKRRKIGGMPTMKTVSWNERMFLTEETTKEKLGEKANKVFFEKLNSIFKDRDAKVNKDLPIIIQLMVGEHVICLISDGNIDTTLVDDINCTKLTTLSRGKADVFLNEGARATSFSKESPSTGAKDIIETHAILYNVNQAYIPTSKKEHVEAYFKRNTQNKLYDPADYKLTPEGVTQIGEQENDPADYNLSPESANLIGEQENTEGYSTGAKVIAFFAAIGIGALAAWYFSTKKS